ncbi:uncharacterized protein LOC121829605 [Peromyscus maniculatus bairdii]|uniref:uncharacterized protein LOC121829605 n=1 Tax=Peromyscus maniculatus bairdii TaxID=230844 RepID=UPI003FD37654
MTRRSGSAHVVRRAKNCCVWTSCGNEAIGAIPPPLLTKVLIQLVWGWSFLTGSPAERRGHPCQDHLSRVSLGEENKHPDYQAKGNLLTSKSFGDKAITSTGEMRGVQSEILVTIWFQIPFPEDCQLETVSK